jgi:hypothetical protein
VDDSQCFLPCYGNAAETCGGYSTYSVWKTAVPAAPIDDAYAFTVVGAGTGKVLLHWANPIASNFAGVLIVRSSAADSVPVDFVPSPGVAYSVGDVVGTHGAVVAYVGSGTDLSITGLVNGAQYFLKAYAFDTAGDYANGVEASATLPVPSGSYLGCYQDSSPGAFPNDLGYYRTVEDCITTAAAAGYEYAALKFGYWCHAGNTLEYAPVDDSQCFLPCYGNAAETCGGYSTYSVWKTAVPAAPIDDAYAFTVVGAGTGKVVLHWANPIAANFAGVMIVRSSAEESIPVDFVPSTGVAYSVGDVVGTHGAVVAYVGTGTDLSIAGLVNGTQYFLKAFAFDTAGDYANGVEASATLPVPSGTYLGCYAESFPTAFPNILGYYPTVEACTSAAAAAGYEYAALEYGWRCHAGNTLAYSLVDDSLCSLPCAGNPAETCGGYAFSVWKTGFLPAPAIFPPSGTYDRPQLVTLSGADGAQIFYTIDGTSPTTGSSLYTGPFTVAGITTVQAIATRSGFSSSVASASYAVVPVLTSIVVQAPSTTVGEGSSQQCTATGYYSDSSTQDVTAQAAWSSSNTGAATISGSGVLTAVHAGTATVSATVATIAGSLQVTIQPPPSTYYCYDGAGNMTARLYCASGADCSPRCP